MTNKYCQGCGAPLKPDVLVCPNCGRLATQQQPNQPRRAVKTVQSAKPARAVKTVPQQQTRQARPQQAAVKRQAQRADEPKPKKKREKREKPDNQSQPNGKKKKIINAALRLATVAIVIGALYFSIFIVQVFRVKVSTYDFSNEMQMSSDNYGEAIGSYFESGKWSVNPFTATCTYTGKTKHSEEYKIVFSAGLSVKIDEIYVDGEKVKNKQIETRLMGMFI
jgi:uncharacterized Zn finger protein (UPF0148 family)